MFSLGKDAKVVPSDVEISAVVAKAATVVVKGECSFKIVQINDVYEIDLLPNYATCKEVEKTSSDTTVIGVLPGDFLAPSLLSSLDKGYGMVDCMDLAGIDYVCIGNHENDIALSHLHERIRQSKFIWLNSNMQSMPLPKDMTKLPEYEIIEVNGSGQKRRVALIGLNTEDPAIYRPGAFGGCTIEPVLSKSKEMYEKIMASENVDLIIPLTHQNLQADKDLGETGLFPLIIGGHDHDQYVETVAGSTIVKAGLNGVRISVITITWPDEQTKSPSVSVKVHEASSFPAKPEVAAAVANHKKLLDELNKSALCPIPPGLTLSSQNMRIMPTTVGTFLCSVIRKDFKADAAVLTGGAIRANRSYKDEMSFSYAHLKSEMPFPTEIVTVNIPGKVLCDMITFTREFGLRTPPVEMGGYLQTDDGVEWSAETNTVVKIAGQPVNPDRIYLTALPWITLSGLDDVRPLLDFKVKSGPHDPNVCKTEESGIPAKDVIVDFFAKMLVLQMVDPHKFDEIDLNKDGVICKEEFHTLAKSKFGDQCMTSLVLDNMFSVVDEDNSGHISKAEVLKLYGSVIH